jgi:glycogen debranching enzyme
MSEDNQTHFTSPHKPLPEIRVGPPRLTIYRGSLVLVTDSAGEIDANTETGLFFRDTRFVSHLKVVINGEKWLPIQSTPLRANAHRLYFTNPELHSLDEAPISPQSLSFQVEREAGDCLYEHLRLCNYSGRRLILRLRVVIDSDFADLFDVHNRRFFSRGMRDSYWDGQARELKILYRSEEFKRALLYRLGTTNGEPHFSNGQILFELPLAPGECWEARNAYVPLCDHESAAAGIRLKPQESRQAFSRASAEEQSDWRSSTTKLAGANYALRTIFAQAVEDIWSLRMHELEAEGELWLPTAGVPWFATLFGRDSLIVSLQCMLVSPPFALGALIKLAELQAREHDPYRDAEPGKIMHEIRYGELAERRLIPHTPYYGTADATILYLIVLSELFRWTADKGVLERLRETALACLSWIDHYGDRDGDGFQEYQTRSPKGYYNQGWKDASDASLYPDGSLVKLPIGTCELQGYVYDAKLRMAQVFEALGESALVDQLQRQAERLRQQFDQAFWLDHDRYIAYCLDGDKRPVASVTSNPGQCLWSGIVEPRRASAIVTRLFKEDMWSGWGIRTLSAEHPAYNPLEYQRGSVWPHDNGIIAAGLAAYGYREEANRVVGAIFDAASMFAHFRLPELFAGFPRDSESCPVQYLQANTPQAWASGCVFHLVRTMLGIHPDAPRGRLYIDPALPEGVDRLRLTNLQVGGDRLSLEFWRSAGKTNFDVIEGRPGRIAIEAGPPPWFAGNAVARAHD